MGDVKKKRDAKEKASIAIEAIKGEHKKAVGILCGGVNNFVYLPIIRRLISTKFFSSVERHKQ